MPMLSRIQRACVDGEEALITGARAVAILTSRSERTSTGQSESSREVSFGRAPSPAIRIALPGSSAASFSSPPPSSSDPGPPRVLGYQQMDSTSSLSKHGCIPWSTPVAVDNQLQVSRGAWPPPRAPFNPRSKRCKWRTSSRDEFGGERGNSSGSSERSGVGGEDDAAEGDGE